ncbi:Riboflavin biosynthesis protein RibBA [Paenibacillus sp. P1XP2]|nr:Riboflavin biosynthesis protein RibBA [Paenibacillus sp. P1XP2]
MEPIHFDPIEDAIQDLRSGKVIIVVDDEDRENEGDFVALAEKATPEVINFMVTEGRGLVCVPLARERAEALELMPMTSQNTDHHARPLRCRWTIEIRRRGFRRRNGR